MLMRVPTTVVVASSAWLVLAAQSPPSSSTSSSSSSSSQHTILAAFAFVRTGERTPILRNDTQILTALGAQQMFALGQNFRTRYIAGGDDNDNSPQKLGVQRVAGLSVDTIDNDQILVQTLDKPYLVSSAQAFMQGLYPPHMSSNGTGKATTAGSLADGSRVDYPLNGYQYASIQAASEEDSNSRYVSGSQNCPMAQVAALDYFTTEAFQKTESANADLFKKLDLAWLEGTLPEAYFNARSALEIADYMSYQYMHNASIHETLSSNDSEHTGVYEQLGYLADEVAWHLYANASDSATASNDQVIGGKTLAGSILDSFRQQVGGQSSGSTRNPKNQSHPLTFYFGEADAMMSLASLLKLDSNVPQFKSIPWYGSAMVFELFSTSSNTAAQSIDANDLWVRFSFHNATDTTTDNQLTSYPLSPTDPSKLEIQWPQFEALLSSFAMQSTAMWCRTCNSASLFCRGASADENLSLNSPSSSSSSIHSFRSRLSPVVGGVIGAFVTLLVAAFCFALAMLIGGVRCYRRPRSTQSSNPHHHAPSTLGAGGFKGSAKLASDQDLSLERGAGHGKRGDAHERMGSWELGHKEFGKEGRRSSESDEYVGEGRSPVRPVEGV